MRLALGGPEFRADARGLQAGSKPFGRRRSLPPRPPRSLWIKVGWGKPIDPQVITKGPLGDLGGHGGADVDPLGGGSMRCLAAVDCEL